jgi:hypothetical protein
MALGRKPTKAPHVQIIDFIATEEDTIECDIQSRAKLASLSAEV